MLPQSGGQVVELGGGGDATIVKTAPVKTAPANKPVAKKVTGCEEGFKLVKGKLQAHHRDGEAARLPGRNQAGA